MYVNVIKTECLWVYVCQWNKYNLDSVHARYPYLITNSISKKEKCSVVVGFVRLYGKIIYVFTSGLSPVHAHKPYDNVPIVPACIFTLCNTRYLK